MAEGRHAGAFLRRLLLWQSPRPVGGIESAHDVIA